jgi:hypothetical protein
MAMITSSICSWATMSGMSRSAPRTGTPPRRWLNFSGSSSTNATGVSLRSGLARISLSTISPPAPAPAIKARRDPALARWYHVPIALMPRRGAVTSAAVKNASRNTTEIGTRTDVRPAYGSTKTPSTPHASAEIPVAWRIVRMSETLAWRQRRP